MKTLTPKLLCLMLLPALLAGCYSYSHCKSRRLFRVRRHYCREVTVHNVLLRNVIDVLESELCKEFRNDLYT